MNLSYHQNLEALSSPCTAILPVSEEDAKSESLENFLASYGIASAESILNDFNGKPDEHLGLYPNHEFVKRVFLFGIGSKVDQGKWKRNALALRAKNKKAFQKEVILDLRMVNSETKKSELVQAITFGLIVGGYSIGLYKTGDNGNGIELSVISIFGDDDLNHHTGFERGKVLGETALEMMSLVNAPSNHKTSKEIAQYAVSAADRYNFSARIIEKEELREIGMHALLSVNRGSEEPARCIVCEYIPEGKQGADLTTVALVGKGVTFDTGGLSIKSSRNMHYMKSDMGGAAAVLGTIEAVARLKLPIHLVCIVPATDNSVDALSIKPGDVISSYSGSTIEVIDTDAEGRLVLADGLAYAIKNYNPDHIIDLATLTGSVIRALGTEAAGLMTKNDQLAQQLLESGEKTGERLWRLPLWDEFGEFMQSDVADIKNLSDRPMAGAITAGKFLEHFTSEHISWAHMDIAGTAFHVTPLAKGHSATGYGIHLLVDWLESLVDSR